MEDRQEAIKHLSAFLRAVGAPIDDDPEMKTTAERVTHAYADHLLSGYQQHPAEILAEATQSKSEALVVVGALPLMTLCPHHLLPAIGTASLAYLPGGQVVGFGALARLMACFARRLSLQEDLAQDVADALVTHIGAKAACCLLRLHPSCMSVERFLPLDTSVTTIAYAGKEARDPLFRSEVAKLFDFSLDPNAPHASGSTAQDPDVA